MENTTDTSDHREKQPNAIGVQGIIINHNNHVLFGYRIGRRYGANTWGLIGGHISDSENPKTALVREVKEETGILVEESDLEEKFVVDTEEPADVLHRQHVYIVRKYTGEPIIKEEDACGELRYFPLSQLPDKIFGPTKTIIDYFLAHYPGVSASEC